MFRRCRMPIRYSDKNAAEIIVIMIVSLAFTIVVKGYFLISSNFSYSDNHQV
jgi:hypothetical protein